jgi:uncharacterized protein (DUF983 family)
VGTTAPRREGGSPTWGDAWRALVCAVSQRCPQCRKGALFKTRFGFTLNERCPVCGLKFDRGNGYFTGAWALNLVISEFVGAAIWLPLAFNRAIPVDQVTAIAIAVSIGLPILGYRPSRAIWIAIDRLLNPVA